MKQTEDNNEEAIRIGVSVIDAWNAHDPRLVAGHYAADYIGHDVGQARPLEGIDGIRLKVTLFLRAFPDAHFTIDEMTTQDNRLVIRWTARGTHKGRMMNIPPTGRAVSISGASFVTLKDGMIHRSYYLWDMAGMLRQMGLLPELSS